MFDWDRKVCHCVGNIIKSSASTTLVKFDELTDSAIEAYVATGTPIDDIILLTMHV